MNYYYFTILSDILYTLYVCTSYIYTVWYNMVMCYELSKCSTCILSFNFYYIELLLQRSKPRQRTSPHNWYVAEPGFKCLLVCIKANAFPDIHHLTKYSCWKLRGNSPSLEGTCWALLSFIFFDYGVAATATSSEVPRAVAARLSSVETELCRLGSLRLAGTLKIFISVCGIIKHEYIQTLRNMKNWEHMLWNLRWKSSLK